MRTGSTAPLRSRPAAQPRRSTVAVRAAVDVQQLRAAREEVAALIKSKSCNPIVIRLAWHDSGTYDKVRRGAGSGR